MLQAHGDALVGAVDQAGVWRNRRWMVVRRRVVPIADSRKRSAKQCLGDAVLISQLSLKLRWGARPDLRWLRSVGRWGADD